MTTLRIVIRGSPGSIQLDALAGVSESAFRLLDDIDASLSREPAGTLDWIVRDLSMGSCVMVVEPRSRRVELNHGTAVAESFIKGFRQIQAFGTTPPYWSEHGLRLARRLLKSATLHGASGVLISDQDESVELDARDIVNADQLVRIERHSIGSVEGSLEMISLHRAPRFIVYHSRTHKAITCRFSAEQMLGQAKDALGRRVGAMGVVFSNAKGEPLRVDVKRLRVFGLDQELPTIASLSGSDPDFTGELSSEDYVRSWRDG